MKERTGILFTRHEIMIEWLVFLAATLLFIINVSAPREHVTNPPPSTQTVTLPQDLQDQLTSYKTLLTASTLNPQDQAAAQATAAAKGVLDLQMTAWQSEITNSQTQIQTSTNADVGIGSDVATLHAQLDGYEKTLPQLEDTLTKSQVNTSEKTENMSVMVAKAVAVTVIGMFAVFVNGLF